MYAVHWFAGKPLETVAALFLDAECKPTVTKTLAQEEILMPDSYCSTLLALAEKFHSSRVILMHNHKDGVMHPSEEDLRMTQMLYQFLKKHSISLFEHLIVNEFDVIPILDESVHSHVSPYNTSI